MVVFTLMLNRVHVFAIFMFNLEREMWQQKSFGTPSNFIASVGCEKVHHNCVTVDTKIHVPSWQNFKFWQFQKEPRVNKDGPSNVDEQTREDSTDRSSFIVCLTIVQIVELVRLVFKCITN